MFEYLFVTIYMSKQIDKVSWGMTPLTPFVTSIEANFASIEY